jgi:hypothetical protein
VANKTFSMPTLHASPKLVTDEAKNFLPDIDLFAARVDLQR